MTIQDISCIGKCSLTVALPILSAIGLEAAIVPTAVLSTHTQFRDFTFRDLTEDLEPIRKHWEKEKFSFEAIYTGYLGSRRQIDIVRDYVRTFGGNGHALIVDPAMADGGKLYVGFDEAFVEEMKGLCGEADVILPNISEAAFLTGSEYPGEEADEETQKELLLKLSELGSKYSIITGVTLSDGSFGFIGYNRESKEFFSYGNPKVPYKSHGTGDIFASTFTGAYVRKGDLFEALKIAADYTSACIRNSFGDPDHVDYGVNFELELPYLIERIGNKANESQRL
jgi:pyridoxine kinase